MSNQLTCAKCGSSRVIPAARIVSKERKLDRVGAIQLGVFRRPGEFLFKRDTRSDLRAQVCGDCGYTELYASDPRLLYEAYREAVEYSA